MKKILTAILLLCLPIADASDWRDTVGRYIDIFEGSKGTPKPVVYPQLGERIQILFPADGVRRIVMSIRKDGETRKETTIYVDGSSIEIVSHGDGWNLSTNNDYIYEWKSGSNECLRIPRDNDQLVRYIYYLTDPSWIMAGLYFEYLNDPDSAETRLRNADEAREIHFKKPRYGFEAVYVSEFPFWFHGYRIRHDDEEAEFLVARPESLSEIPADVRSRTKNKTFRDSDARLDRHMVFL